jgi:hypothetical protein
MLIVLTIESLPFVDPDSVGNGINRRIINFGQELIKLGQRTRVYKRSII